MVKLLKQRQCVTVYEHNSMIWKIVSKPDDEMEMEYQVNLQELEMYASNLKLLNQKMDAAPKLIYHGELRKAPGRDKAMGKEGFVLVMTKVKGTVLEDMHLEGEELAKLLIRIGDYVQELGNVHDIWLNDIHNNNIFVDGEDFYFIDMEFEMSLDVDSNLLFYNRLLQQIDNLYPQIYNVYFGGFEEVSSWKAARLILKRFIEIISVLKHLPTSFKNMHFCDPCLAIKALEMHSAKCKHEEIIRYIFGVCFDNPKGDGTKMYSGDVFLFQWHHEVPEGTEYATDAIRAPYNIIIAKTDDPSTH